MITLLMGFMSKRAAQIVAFVVVPLLILGAFWLALDAYGDSRYHEGEKDTDAKYQAASDELLRKAAEARGAADKQAAARVADYAAQVKDEKEKIDEAVAEGRSPFDALFPVDNGL